MATESITPPRRVIPHARRQHSLLCISLLVRSATTCPVRCLSQLTRHQPLWLTRHQPRMYIGVSTASGADSVSPKSNVCRARLVRASASKGPNRHQGVPVRRGRPSFPGQLMPPTFTGALQHQRVRSDACCISLGTNRKCTRNLNQITRVTN